MNILNIKTKNKRTLNILKNVFISTVLKSGSIGISFLLVRLTLNLFDKERYGLWLTLSSVIGWAHLFDIGLGNGLRNRLAEAIAVKNNSLAKTYISTAFALVTVITLLVFILFLIINLFLNWNIIMNTNAENRNTLSLMALIIFAFFALQFIFKLSTSVLFAIQKPAFVDLIHISGQVLSFLLIILLTYTGKQSLLLLCLALSGCPALALIIAYFFVFSGKYKEYSPSLKYIDLKYSKYLMSLGFTFFIVQLCSLIVFSTSNIIIARIFSPAEVVTYNMAFKYLSVATYFFNIISMTSWSAFTEAYVKEDIAWVKNMLRKLVLLWVIFCFGILIMVLASDFFYKIWIGDAVVIPIRITIVLAVYTCIGCWNTIFYTFNSSVSKMYIQIRLSLICGIAFIPLAYVFSKIFGLAGITVAMGLSILHGSIISPIQAFKLINGKAKGIWNK